MIKVNVQKELLRMRISGYKHEKKRNSMYLSKTKMHKMELILGAVHSTNCISDFAFLSVNRFQRFSFAKRVT